MKLMAGDKFDNDKYTGKMLGTFSSIWNMLEF
jgi:hypothetical protein